jgi:3-dehydroquinate dehydratase / shikimate dehydrogenase
MTKLLVTISEATPAAAIRRIRSIEAPDAGFELRFDAFDGDADPAELRGATARTLMYTRRSGEGRRAANREELARAAEAGFDLIDVEVALDGTSVDFDHIAGSRELGQRFGERVIYSLHDFDRTPDIGSIATQLAQAGRFKIAATAQSFDDNLRLLAALEPGATIFGMGARGLYSRILAPFFGSELAFVAPDEESIAAPGQLTLEAALDIYGDAGSLRRPDAIFAVIGNPASHSRSPRIHNPIFREQGLAAAYSIIDCDDPLPIFAQLSGASPLFPRGLSITAPFKEEAFRFALESDASISQLARRARAVNTLVRIGDQLIAENTDAAGFISLISALPLPPRALVIGAGGTARAALTALEMLGIPAVIANRSRSRGEELAREFGAAFVDLRDAADTVAELVIDTLPASAGVAPAELLGGRHAPLILADYSGERAAAAEAMRQADLPVMSGLALLEAQAGPQSSLFTAAARALARQEARG